MPTNDIEATQAETITAVAATAPIAMPGLVPVAAGVVLGLASWNFLKGILAEDKKKAGDHFRDGIR